MRLDELRPEPGSRHRPKRLGCGRGSGHGKTSTRGHKGQRARSGSGKRPGFEGGQMPLFKRIPKKGFKSLNPQRFALVNVDDLESRFDDGAAINAPALLEKGLIKKLELPVKLLGRGEVKKKFFCEVRAFSLSAKEKIEQAGGMVKKI